MLDFETAARRLALRWMEQCEKYPLMRTDIPLAPAGHSFDECTALAIERVIPSL